VHTKVREDGEGIATLAIACGEVAFEIHAPGADSDP
jgi:hypothetical protein